MAWHSKYWSCGKFADWVRGTPKLSAGTSKEWREWKREASSAHPIRFWIAEEALDSIQNIFTWVPEKINSVRYYLNNRFVIQTHALVAHPQDIPRGQWRDVGNRFLPTMFNALVDFVEIECAWMHVAWDDKARAEYDLPWWRKQWWTRWFVQWRNSKAGLAHLDWEISLVYNEDMGVYPGDELYGKPTQQAEGAKEVKELYLWWTTVYRNRPDPYEVGGWSDLCEKRRSQFDDVLWEDETEAQRAETRNSLDRTHKIEAAYEAEDEAMMIRLIKIRHKLWT